MHDTSTTAGKIAVMQAAVEGKEIEWRAKTQSEWFVRIGGFPHDYHWNWNTYDYRVKPEPLRCWVVNYGNACGSVAYQSLAEATEAARHLEGNCTAVEMIEVNN